MNFATFKTTLAGWLNRTDLTSQLGDFANMALQELENTEIAPGRSWKYMEYRGTTTGSEVQISFPTSMKSIRLLRVYDAANNYYGKPMTSVTVDQLISMYPDLVNVTGEPLFYAWQHYTSEILVAPKPDKSYTFEIVCYKYTADMSGDSDTNWWLTYHWRVLLWGALRQAEAYVVGDARLEVWKQKYIESLRYLQGLELSRDFATGPMNISSVKGE